MHDLGIASGIPAPEQQQQQQGSSGEDMPEPSLVTKGEDG